MRVSAQPGKAQGALKHLHAPVAACRCVNELGRVCARCATNHEAAMHLHNMQAQVQTCATPDIKPLH